MRHHCCLHLRSCWVHLHNLSNFRILHSRHMYLNMRFMVLVDKRFERFTSKYVHVLSDWVNRGLIVFHRYELCRILNPQNIEHFSMQEGEVIKLWCALGQLKNCLVLDNLLGHCRRIWIRYGNNLDVRVIRLLGFAATFDWVIWVLLWCVLSNDAL